MLTYKFSKGRNTYIFKAITLLGGQHYMQRCSDLKVCSLDSHEREILIEIRNMRSENIPKGATGMFCHCNMQQLKH